MKAKNYLSICLSLILGLFYRLEAQRKYSLEEMATSDYQWTGIAISKENRMFVNYPSWNVPSPFKVAEIVNGKEVAYPSAQANELFICVQSVVIDDKNRLWILDPANPQFGGVAQSGAKLFQIDLKTNQIVKTFVFPKTVALPESYLNDVRFDTKNEIAYITDSTLGGIVVLDLNTGKSWRALENITEVKANLPALNFPTTGKWDGIVHSDGIEISKDRKTLYFQALTGNILYKIPTKILRNTKKSIAERKSKIQIENQYNVATDGLWLSDNQLFMGDLEKEKIWVYDLKTKKGHNLDTELVRWADSFAQDNQGNIYFTTSQINYPENERIKYQVFKLIEK